MSSLDTIDKSSSSSAELDVLLVGSSVGSSAKQAARIPLPPSLSLTSSHNSTEYSIETEYYNNKGSDLRDDTHDVDMSVGGSSSMREGAEDVSECSMSTDKNLSVKTEYIVQSSTSRDSSYQGSKASEAPELVYSMSSGSNKAFSVKVTASGEVPMTRSSSSNQMDSRSLSSRKSSKGGGDVSGIPLPLTKSRSTQSSMSKSSKQSKTASIINNISVPSSRSSSSALSMSRSASTSTKLSAAPSVEKSPSQVEIEDLVNSMSLSSQTSSLKGEGIPLSLTKSRSTQSSMSKSSKQSKASSINNISVPSSRSSSSALSMSRSASTSSKLSAAPSVEKSPSQVEIEDLVNSMSLSSQTSSLKGEGIPLSLTKSRSTQSSMSKSSKQSKASSINNISVPSSRSSSSALSMSRSASTSSKLSAAAAAPSVEKSSSQVENDPKPLDDLLKSISLISRTSSKSIPLTLTKSRSTQSSMSKSSSKQGKADVDLLNSLSLSSQSSSLKGEGIPLALTKSRSTQSSLSKSSKQAKADLALLNSLSADSQTSSLKGEGIPLTLTKSRSTQSIRSSSSKQAKADLALLNSLSLNTQSSLKSDGTDIELNITKSRSAQSTKSSSSKQAKVEMPLDLPKSMSAGSQKSSKSAVAGIPLALTKSRSTQSTKSSSSKQAKAEMPLGLPKSMSAGSQKSSKSAVAGIPLALTKSRSTQSTKSSSSKQAKAEMPLVLPKSMSAGSQKSSKSAVAGIPLALTKSRSTQSTKSNSTSKKLSSETNGQEAQATPVKISLSTSKEGLDSKTTIDQMPLNLNLPKRMSSISQKLSKGKGVDCIPLTLTKSRSNKTSSSKQASPQSDSAPSPMVITALEGNVLWSIMNNEMSHDMNAPVLPHLSPTSTTSKESPEERAAAGLPPLTPHTRLVSAEDEDGPGIWDNSIEMSYSNFMGEFMDESNKENVTESTDAPVSPRKKLSWSSKILGRTGGQRKIMTKSIMKHFKKKKHHNKEGQGKLIEAIDSMVQEFTDEGICGELDDSIEKSLGEDRTKASTEETDKEEVSESIETDIGKEAFKLTEAATEEGSFAPAWAEAMCNNFQEICDVAGRWNFHGPVIENDIEVPETKLDENKAREILVAVTQLFALRQIIEEKSAELKKQDCLEKFGVLNEELSDAKRQEGSAFAIVKTLLNSLSAEERGYAVGLGDEVAKVAQEVESLKCEAVVEIELSL